MLLEALSSNDALQSGVGTEIVVVGSTMMDLVTYTDTLPKSGETIFGKSFATSFGGKGANQAVQCAKLGIKVSMVGKIGSDKYGDEYMMQFDREGVENSCIQRSSTSSTGTASIQVDSTGQNTIIIVTGANQELTAADIDQDQVEVRIVSASVAIFQNEISADATAAALEICKKHGTISILNPAPAGGEEVKRLIRLCDIVCPNEIELSVLTGLPTSTDAEVEIAANELLKLGCKIVVVTLGARGAYLCPVTTVTGTDCDSKAGEEIGAARFFSAGHVEAVDTVGAGDSFIGAFAANIARGSSIDTAIQRAIFCASVSVTRKGAQVSYISLQELQHLNPAILPLARSPAQIALSTAVEAGSAVLQVFKQKLRSKLGL